jgi:hypothetical protein
MIKENVQKVFRRIADTCARIDVLPERIGIVCVSKGRTEREIASAVDAGLGCMGENKVQEASRKYGIFPGVRWQMIGHLQSNKVKEALKIFDLIHSVDSVDLAREIDKQALKLGKVQDVFLEVKTSPEESKFGFGPRDLDASFDQIRKFGNIKVGGLMTIAPCLGDPRPYFARLRELRDRLDPSWHLSMGMSDDFEAAIEEGADIVRLGRIIFEGEK